MRHDLERRAGRVGALDGAVQQRERAVLVELLPARDERPREISLGSNTARLTMPRMPPSRGSITTAGAALHVRHGFLERVLDVQIEREVEVVPGPGDCGGPSSSAETRLPIAFTTTNSAPSSPRRISS